MALAALELWLICRSFAGGRIFAAFICSVPAETAVKDAQLYVLAAFPMRQKLASVLDRPPPTRFTLPFTKLAVLVDPPRSRTTTVAADMVPVMSPVMVIPPAPFEVTFTRLPVLETSMGPVSV